jgi:hypothetical protein
MTPKQQQTTDELDLGPVMSYEEAQKRICYLKHTATNRKDLIRKIEEVYKYKIEWIRESLIQIRNNRDMVYVTNEEMVALSRSVNMEIKRLESEKAEKIKLAMEQQNGLKELRDMFDKLY